MRILVFAPHNDDEVLGVGGTMAKLAKQGNEVFVCEVTAGDLKDEMVQRQKREALESHKALGVKETYFLDLPVVGLKETDTRVKNAAFKSIVDQLKPNTVFIPFKGDMHIDHREVVEAAMVALRPINNPELLSIYAYETLTETGWSVQTPDNVFVPNYWVDISDFLDLKISAMKCHASQLLTYPSARSLEAIEALAKYRGSTVQSNYAEAFMLIRGINR